jgi:uncharacterized membrane protein
MTIGEILFLALILGATGIFAVTLANYSRG